MYFHVIYTNETIEGGYIPYVHRSVHTCCQLQRNSSPSDDQITDQIKVLNTGFANAAIIFGLANITHTENADWFNNASPGSAAQTEMKNALRTGGAGDLNIYTVG